MEGNIKTTYDNDKKPNLFEEKLVQILHYFSFKQMKKDIYDTDTVFHLLNIFLDLWLE